MGDAGCTKAIIRVIASHVRAAGMQENVNNAPVQRLGWCTASSPSDSALLKGDMEAAWRETNGHHEHLKFSVARGLLSHLFCFSVLLGIIGRNACRKCSSMHHRE